MNTAPIDWKMKLLNLIDEDFVNYKKPSMFIAFPYCSFKCDKENGAQLCQNWALSHGDIINVSVDNFKFVSVFIS